MTPSRRRQHQTPQHHPAPGAHRTKRTRRRQGRPTVQRRLARRSTLRDPTTLPYLHTGTIMNTTKQNAGTEERGQCRKVPPPEELVVRPRQTARLGTGLLVASTLVAGHRGGSTTTTGAVRVRPSSPSPHAFAFPSSLCLFSKKMVGSNVDGDEAAEGRRLNRRTPSSLRSGSRATRRFETRAATNGPLCCNRHDASILRVRTL